MGSHGLYDAKPIQWCPAAPRLLSGFIKLSEAKHKKNAQSNSRLTNILLKTCVEVKALGPLKNPKSKRFQAFLTAFLTKRVAKSRDPYETKSSSFLIFRVETTNNLLATPESCFCTAFVSQSHLQFASFSYCLALKRPPLVLLRTNHIRGNFLQGLESRAKILGFRVLI